MKLITLPLFALALALVAAAAQTPPPPLSNPLPPPPLTSTLPPSITPTPTPLPRPLPPPPIKNTGSAAYEPTQLAFDDTDLVDLIKILARQADLNVLFDPKVSGGIAIASTNNPDGRASSSPYRVPAFRMNDVTPDQAMEAILANYNLQLVRDPRTRIARVTIRDEKQPDPLVTKILQLKYSNPTNIMAAIAPLLGTRS